MWRACDGIDEESPVFKNHAVFELLTLDVAWFLGVFLNFYSNVSEWNGEECSKDEVKTKGLIEVMVRLIDGFRFTQLEVSSTFQNEA